MPEISRSIAPGTVMVSIVILLVMPIMGVTDAIGRWIPTHLAGAFGTLFVDTASASDYLGASLVAIASSSALLWLPARLAKHRELRRINGPGRRLPRPRVDLSLAPPLGSAKPRQSPVDGELTQP